MLQDFICILLKKKPLNMAISLKIDQFPFIHFLPFGQNYAMINIFFYWPIHKKDTIILQTILMWKVLLILFGLKLKTFK